MKDLFTLLEFAPATAALFFTEEGHFLFIHRDKQSGETTSKYLRTPQVVQAFTDIALDTGYLPEGVVRAGSRRVVSVRAIYAQQHDGGDRRQDRRIPLRSGDGRLFAWPRAIRLRGPAA